MNELDAILDIIQGQAARDEIRITQHAQQEMIEERISMVDVLHALSNARIVENYPEHRRGACCLIHGTDESARDLHVVCTTTQPLLIIITVNLPLPPKWITPNQRRAKP